MGDKLIMSKKERQRKVILEQIKSGQLSRTDASKRLKLSGRQLIRILKRYIEEGDAGLIHRSRGKPSSVAYPEAFKKQVLRRYEERYAGFGPTFGSEKLEEDDKLKVHPETLRLWLKQGGYWHPRRKRKSHRQRRARRARFGELLQLDGSIHAWFDGVEEKPCLMNMVDDATGKTLALMDTGETTQGAFALLRWWIEQAGIPMAIYVDLKSLYIAPKSLRTDEDGDLIEPDWLTHFSRACSRLGIEVIKAYSPQAKGRVERSHGVYQDRLVKELKLKGIKDIDTANQFLSDTFVNKLNSKFAKPATSDEDAHIALTADNDLDQILCWEVKRQLKNDWTIQFQNRYYQITKMTNLILQPKSAITVRTHMDHKISLWYKEQQLDFCEIEKPQKPVKERKGRDLTKIAATARANKHNTPWGKFNPDWLGKKPDACPQGPPPA